MFNTSVRQLLASWLLVSLPVVQRDRTHVVLVLAVDVRHAADCQKNNQPFGGLGGLESPFVKPLLWMIALIEVCNACVFKSHRIRALGCHCCAKKYSSATYTRHISLAVAV